MSKDHLRRVIPVLAATGVVAMAIFAPVSTAKPAPVFINGDSFSNYTFAPKTLEVNRGATVHWSWDSNASHNVTFKKLGKHSVTGASETYKLQFKKAGTYKYRCTIHDFKGKIVVK